MKLYRCTHCNNIVEKVVDRGVPVFCCGEEMVELTANTVDAAFEKHVPVALYNEGELHVKVGEVMHPMSEAHYITTIFVCMGNQVLRADLTPSDIPEAKFALGTYHGKVEVYEYCNLHGLWKTELTL